MKKKVSKFTFRLEERQYFNVNNLTLLEEGVFLNVLAAKAYISSLAGGWPTIDDERVRALEKKSDGRWKSDRRDSSEPELIELKVSFREGMEVFARPPKDGEKDRRFQYLQLTLAGDRHQIEETLKYLDNWTAPYQKVAWFKKDEDIKTPFYNHD